MDQAIKKAERKAPQLAHEARESWNEQVLDALGAPAEEPPKTERALVVGDQVRLNRISTPGKIVAVVGERELEVEVGRVRMRVPREEARLLMKETAPDHPQIRRGPPGMTLDEPAPEVPAEINVIGTTAEEARERVDKFLDDAYLARRFRLRVVHGHGKGILRKSLHEMFSSHPHVEKYYAAPQNEGGTGATIVELRL
jgi:DNA mismatch repair protein MutS2